MTLPGKVVFLFDVERFAALPARGHVRSTAAYDVFLPGRLSVCKPVVSWFAVCNINVLQKS